jgi:small GTP-binding protein
MFDYFIKTIIIGNSGVGKSTILSTYNNYKFSEKIEPTIGIDLFTTNVIWNKKTIKMHIWDTSGNLNYVNLVKTYLSACIGVFAVFNLNDYDTFNNLDNWITFYINNRKTYNSIIIIGNRFSYNNVVNYEKIEALRKKYNAFYLEIDAKNPISIGNMFKKMSEIILEDYKMNQNNFRNIEGFRDELKIKNNGDFTVEIGDIESNNSNGLYCCKICNIQ